METVRLHPRVLRLCEILWCVHFSFPKKDTTFAAPSFACEVAGPRYQRDFDVTLCGPPHGSRKIGATRTGSERGDRLHAEGRRGLGAVGVVDSGRCATRGARTGCDLRPRAGCDALLPRARGF